mmetsp:Transcript_7549/g.19420  ORF Transcript_7549/g.19420 Transcript_7549/m.19420 type:complete len:239 (+) Transcript_7549:665-1381(+)
MTEKALLVGDDSMASTTSRAVTVPSETLLAETVSMALSSSPMGMSSGPAPEALLPPKRPPKPLLDLSSGPSPARDSSGSTASGLRPRRRRMAGALSERCITASCFTMPYSMCSEPTSAAPPSLAATIPSWMAFSDSLSKRSYGTEAARHSGARLLPLPKGATLPNDAGAAGGPRAKACGVSGEGLLCPAEVAGSRAWTVGARRLRRPAERGITHCRAAAADGAIGAQFRHRGVRGTGR